jgi:hypothetical protein
MLFPQFRRVVMVFAATLVAHPTTEAAPVLELETRHEAATENRLEYDEFIAQIPRQQALTASEALAQINIALHHARQRAAAEACGGRWIASGRLVRQYGPALKHNGGADAGARFWRFRSFREPQLFACDGFGRAAVFLEISRHLPSWMSIRPAGQITAYQQGRSLLAGEDAFLAIN